MSNQNNIGKNRETKRQQILKGAVKVFTENGFDASSMDKIAEVAGVSKITVYKHFQSKENLFQEIVSDFLRQSDEKKPLEYSKIRPLKEQIWDFASAELYWVSDPVQRGLSKLLASVYLFKPDFVKKTMTGHKFHEDFINWLNAAQEDGKLAFQSAELAANILYGMIEGCLTWNILLTDGEFLPLADTLLPEIIDVFLCRYSCVPDKRKSEPDKTISF